MPYLTVLGLFRPGQTRRRRLVILSQVAKTSRSTHSNHDAAPADCGSVYPQPQRMRSTRLCICVPRNCSSSLLARLTFPLRAGYAAIKKQHSAPSGQALSGLHRHGVASPFGAPPPRLPQVRRPSPTPTAVAVLLSNPDGSCGAPPQPRWWRRRFTPIGTEMQWCAAVRMPV